MARLGGKDSVMKYYVVVILTLNIVHLLHFLTVEDDILEIGRAIIAFLILLPFVGRTFGWW